MAEQQHSSSNPHAILVAYPLQGHVIPAVHLATALARRGFTITFINTLSIHHQSLKARAAANPDSAGEDIFSEARNSGLDIRYTTVSDGLPLQFDRSLHHDQFMFALLHVLSAHVELAIQDIVRRSEEENNNRVRFLIADTFFVWPAAVSKKFDLLYVSFWTESALVFSLYYHMDLLTENRHFACNDIREDKIEYIPGVEAIDPKDMPSYLQHSDPSPSSVENQIIFKAFDAVKSAHALLCNTVQELEPATISALNNKIPFFAVGPIFPPEFSGNGIRLTTTTSLWSERDCTQWLDSKSPKSVLYVSFGSYAHVTKQDLTQVAEGLYLSGVNFIWVLRPDIVSSQDADPLSAGFKRRIGERGMIVQWCRQVEVLANPAIGGFLTHCGWNSIMESVWCGVPLLCFPLLTDQFTNRKLVVDDWKVGMDLRVGRDVIRMEEVSENAKGLIWGDSGDKLRTRIRELRSIMEAGLNGSSLKNMDHFTSSINKYF